MSETLVLIIAVVPLIGKTVLITVAEYTVRKRLKTEMCVIDRMIRENRENKGTSFRLESKIIENMNFILR